MTEEITPLQQLLIDVLRGADGWMTRKALSDAIGRPNRLNPHDVEVLEKLVEMGTVERTQRIRPGATVWKEYIYRIV